MRYSVIILSYNKLKYVQRTVDALTQPQVGEIILCDDCSNDGTYDWALESGKFHKVWKKEAHDGYCLNTIRNQGVLMSSFPYVVLLDGDCKPDDTLFDGHDRIFELYPESISVGATNRYDETASNLLGLDQRREDMGDKEIREIPWNDCFGGNIAFPKTLWEKLNGFDEDFNGYWGFDDLDFSYRSSRLDVKSYMHRKAIAKHMRHPTTAPDHNNCQGRNFNLLIQKHGNLYG